MLLSNIIPGFSLAEAKDSLTEYEQFKTAMEVGICVSLTISTENSFAIKLGTTFHDGSIVYHSIVYHTIAS